MSEGSVCRPVHSRLAGLAAVLLGLSLSAGAARAIEVEDFDVGNARELYQLCSVAEGVELYTEATLFCYGYFTGAIHYHRAVIGPDMPPIVCAPEGTTTRDVVGAYVTWAAARAGDAEVMDGPPIRAALQAAMETWPCE